MDKTFYNECADIAKQVNVELYAVLNDDKNVPEGFDDYNVVAKALKTGYRNLRDRLIFMEKLIHWYVLDTMSVSMVTHILLNKYRFEDAE